MTCAACGTENEIGRKFCGECGARLAVACPACGMPNPPGTKFCGECGQALADLSTPGAPRSAGSAAAVPTTERRLVSVLFADLVGFTTISEQRDAEDVRALLDRYFETSREVIGRYGGTIEKFIGDAVMAVWGTPVAQEDDAERAVRAALDLVDAVRRIGGDAGIPDLALRAGIHTGEAVVTIGATGMGMVAGDLVNTAARLQGVAAPGTVLVGEGTRRAAEGAVVFEPAGEQALKGKVSPVAAFRALRIVAQRGGVGRSDLLEPPFVGRDSELQLIKDFYHATARERGPRLVSVIGQAGIGKSRLAWEFLKYIDGVTEIVYWHQGRSPAYGDGISFWALGEMVRMRASIEEGADEATTRERLAATLGEHVPDPDERRMLTDPLLHLLGIEAPVRDRAQLFSAWRTFFERIAERAPVVMVFEDLQWADDGMLDFVEELLTWSRGKPMYIITLARPDLLDRRTSWGAGHRSFTSLGLSPLSPDEMRALIVGVVPGLPESLVAQIVERSEGIPLYAVELVRTLLNGGRIVREADRFRLVGDLSQLTVPESLQALIAARIDALPPAERTLVQDASVLGLSFSDAALRAVARSAGDEVAGMLQHLLQREVLTLEDDPRSPGRGQFRFVQGLLREVAYATLSREDRRSRHLAAARHYEALGDDELAGVLAQHYVDAYHAHPEGAEGAAVAAQARVALRAAAARATALGSLRRAHSYVASALAVAGDPPEELELQLAAFDAAASAGLFEAAVGHADRAIELATVLERHGDRRRMQAWLANVLLEGQQSRAKQVLADALAEPGLTPDDEGYLELAVIAAKAEMRMQNDARAIELTDAALPPAEAAGREDYVLDLVITRAVSLVNVGRVTEAIVTLTGALSVATRRSLNDAVNRAAVNLGYALAPDDPAAAFAVSRDSLDHSIRLGVVWSIRYLLGNAVDAAIEVGEWDWALEVTDEHEAIFTEPAERLWFGTFRAVIGAYRGEDTAALAEELYASSRHFDDAQYRSVGAYSLSVALMLAGDTARLVELADEGLKSGVAGVDASIYAARSAIWDGELDAARRMRDAFAASSPGRRTELLTRTMDAGIAMLEGRRSDARGLYADALRAWREMGVPLWQAMTGLDVAITGAMEGDERDRVIAETREILVRLRAQALLDRLDAAATAERPAAAAGHADPTGPSAEVVAQES